MLLAHDTYCGEFSNPVSKDRWGPEALGRAGALRGQGHRGWARVAPLLPPSPSGGSLQFGIHAGTWLPLGLLGSACVPVARVDEVGLALATPEGPLQSLRGGACDHERLQISPFGAAEGEPSEM